MASSRMREQSMGRQQRGRPDSIANTSTRINRVQEAMQPLEASTTEKTIPSSSLSSETQGGSAFAHHHHNNNHGALRSPRGAQRGSSDSWEKGSGGSGDVLSGEKNGVTAKSAIPALPMSRLGGGGGGGEEEGVKSTAEVKPSPHTISNPSSSDSPRGYIQAPGPRPRPSSRVRSAPPARAGGMLPLGESEGSIEATGAGGYTEEEEPDTRWTKTMQEKAAAQNRGYMARIKAISFSGPEYNDPSLPFGASIDFYKLLAPHPDAIWKPRDGAASPGKGGDRNTRRLQLLMPPTIAHHDFDVTAFFTSPDGYVSRKDDLHHTDVYRMMKPRGRTPEALLPSWPVAVFKSRRVKSHNDSILVQMGDLLAYSDGTKNTGHCCLQQYVHCASPKANLVRAVWKNRGRPGYVILIVNKVEKGTRPTRLELSPSRDQLAGLDPLDVAKAVRLNACNLGYITVTEMPQACIVSKASGRGWQEPIDIAGRIASYVERGPKFDFRFEELVVDFIRDSNGRWWFIQVKAFRVQQPQVAWALDPDRATREFSTDRKAAVECRGDYCNTLKKQEDLAAFEEEATTVATSMKAKGFEMLSSAEKRQYMERWKEGKKGTSSLSSQGKARASTDGSGDKKERGRRKAEEGSEGAQSTSTSTTMMMLPMKSIVLDRLDMETHGVKWYVEGKGSKWVQLNVEDCITLESSHQYGQLFVQLTDGAEADLRLMQYWIQKKGGKAEAGKQLKRVVYDTGAMPRPKRKGPLLPHNRFHSFYYNMVPLCHDCFRIYLSKDQKRHLGRLSLKEDPPHPPHPPHTAPSALKKLQQPQLSLPHGSTPQHRSLSLQFGLTPQQRSLSLQHAFLKTAQQLAPSLQHMFSTPVTRFDPSKDTTYQIPARNEDGLFEPGNIGQSRSTSSVGSIGSLKNTASSLSRTSVTRKSFLAQGYQVTARSNA